MDAVIQLLTVMAKLRDPVTGCPWDREQTYRSIVSHTIEEAYEVADAAERGSLPELKDELGDLLFQVIFLARIAEEGGEFDFNDICLGLVQKLIRRHPHVFAESETSNSANLDEQWERIKAAERDLAAAQSPFSGIPIGLPSLSRAVKVQRRASRSGFDWNHVNQILEKVSEEMDELRAVLSEKTENIEDLEAELGDVLFTWANVARHLSIDPETALRKAVNRFQERTTLALSMITEADQTSAKLTPDELNNYWEAAKSSLSDPKKS